MISQWKIPSLKFLTGKLISEVEELTDVIKNYEDSCASGALDAQDQATYNVYENLSTVKHTVFLIDNFLKDNSKNVLEENKTKESEIK